MRVILCRTSMVAVLRTAWRRCCLFPLLQCVSHLPQKKEQEIQTHSQCESWREINVDNTAYCSISSAHLFTSFWREMLFSQASQVKSAQEGRYGSSKHQGMPEFWKMNENEKQRLRPCWQGARVVPSHGRARSK